MAKNPRECYLKTMNIFGNNNYRRTIPIIFGLFFICLIANAEPVNYVSLMQLAQKHNLNRERDSLTGREIFSGNGFNLIASGVMSTMMVNNKLTVLEDRLKSINGQLAVTQNDYNKIDGMFEVAAVKIETQKVKSAETKTKLLRKVVIDPGHGGNFRGCKSVNGQNEKDINLDISKKLRDLLEDNNIKVVMTRTSDKSLSSNLNEDLKRRVEVANREAPDLFISIHCNWSDDSSVSGFEIYYSPENTVMPSLNRQAIGGEKPDDYQTQKALVHILKHEFTRRTVEMAGEFKKQMDKLPSESRGVRKANFRVIKYSEYPSLLVEADYLSNKEVSANFLKDSHRQEIAEKIKQAILLYNK